MTIQGVSQASAEASFTEPSRILVVEDEGIIGLRLEVALVNWGYEVVGPVTSGEAALRSVEEHPPDLVLMDVQLAGEMDGIETAARIRERLDVPIIYLTAYSERMVMEKVKHTQPYGFLTKPVRAEELGATVEVALYKHQMEAKLRASERKYRALIQNIQAGVVVHGGDSRVIACNAKAQDLLGLTEGQVLGREAVDPAWRFLREDGTPMPVEEYPVIQVLDTGQPLCGYMVGICRPDRDEAVWVTVDAEPIFDAADTIEEVIISFMDITERKRAGERLRESESKLRSLIEQSPSGILMCDERGRIITWNGAQERLSGIGEEDAVGQYLWDVTFQMAPEEECTPQTCERVEAAMEEMLRTGQVMWPRQAREQVIRHPDGAQRVVETMVFAVEMDEGFNLCSIVQDITGRKQAEEALRVGEELYRSLVETAPDAIVLSNLEGDILFCNQQTAVMHGFASAEEMVGKNVFDFIAPEDRERAWTKTAHVLDGETVKLIEYTMLRRDGTRFCVELSASAIRDDQGNPQALIGVTRDITERKRTEGALRESEATARALLKAPTDVAALIDTEGVILDANETMARRVDKPIDELIGMTVWELFPPDVTEYRKAILARVVESGQPVRVEDSGPGIWYDTVVYPILDAQNEVSRLAIIARDITEKRRMEEALRESEERFRGVFETSPTGIAIVDTMTQQFLEANASYLQILGYSLEELQHLTVMDVTHPDDWERESEMIDAYLGDSLPNYVVEKRYVRKRGEIRWVRTTGDVLFVDPDAPPLAIANVEDITERKQAEDALRAAKERLEILHEVDAAILAAQSPEDIAQAVLKRLHDLVPYQRASVSKIDPTQERGRDVVVLTYSDGGLKEVASSAWQPLSNGEVIKAARRGQTHVVPDLAALNKPTHLERYLEAQGVKSYVSAPLIFRGELMGSLNLAMDQPNSFRLEHVEILEEIASSLAVAVQQANLLEQTRRDAETKTLLLREVNHRVMNNLDMILAILELEMDQPRSQDERVAQVLQAVLQDICSRIRGMATVHHLLADDERASLDPGVVAEQVIHAALSGSPIQHQITVEVEAGDDLPRISSQRAVTLALILNELSTNSAKYGFAERVRGEIRVEVERWEAESGEPGVRLVFRDDGPGWPEDVLAGDRRGMGLWLVESSATRTLGGEISWRNDDGAMVEVRFPVRLAT